MVLKIYNSLSRKLEVFEPISSQQVTLYTCGPTVYNYPHIGNYRAYIFGDILKRTLTFAGYTVKHVMNLTDIDDKTIRDSQKAGKSLLEFTEFFTQEFYKDRDALNIVPADAYTKATDYITEMVILIEKLLQNGYAYKSDDGSIYFDIARDKEYGKLAHIDMAALRANAAGRMLADEYDKDHVQDFALWKEWDATDGDVFWEPKVMLGRETSLGKGRPGWHIECSAMSMKNLGETIDIHTGGVDNMFPHHENEIAQSECATGKPFVHYWMHNEWLMVNGKKMAKSAGNFYTLRDIIEKGYSAKAFRYLTLGTHYRTPLNFSLESLSGSQTALQRLGSAYNSWDSSIVKPSEKYLTLFSEAILEDLNTPLALGVVWNIVKDETLSTAEKRATVDICNTVLGLDLSSSSPLLQIPENIKKLLDERAEARINKNWQESDRLRNVIEQEGYDVLDTAQGTTLTKKG